MLPNHIKRRSRFGTLHCCVYFIRVSSSCKQRVAGLNREICHVNSWIIISSAYSSPWDRLCRLLQITCTEDYNWQCRRGSIDCLATRMVLIFPPDHPASAACVEFRMLHHATLVAEGIVIRVPPNATSRSSCRRTRSCLSDMNQWKKQTLITPEANSFWPFLTAANLSVLAVTNARVNTFQIIGKVEGVKQNARWRSPHNAITLRVLRVYDARILG
jgi:hypothetical protein